MTLEAQVKEFEHLKALKMKMMYRSLIMQELDQVEDSEHLEKIYTIQHQLCHMNTEKLEELFSLLDIYMGVEDNTIRTYQKDIIHEVMTKQEKKDLSCIRELVSHM